MDNLCVDPVTVSMCRRQTPLLGFLGGKGGKCIDPGAGITHYSSAMGRFGRAGQSFGSDRRSVVRQEAGRV